MDKKEIENKLERIMGFMEKDELSPDEKKTLFKELEEILKADPNNLEALNWMGLYYQGEGDFETAISYYQQIVMTAPNSSDATLAKESIKDCREILSSVDELFEIKTEYAQNKNPSIFRNLSPIWLFLIKVVVLLVAVKFLVL